MPWSVAAGLAGAVISAGASSDASNAASASSAASTAASSQSSADRLAFDKQQYVEGAGDRAFASDMARTTATNQAADRVKYNNLQDEQIARGRVYQGAEDNMLTSAQGYDTPDRRAAAVQGASADMQQQIDAQQDSSARDMERNGVNPNSGKAQSMQAQLGIAGAAAKAGASYKAGKDVETQGYARNMDALGLGKGLVGNQATQAGLQLASGNSAVNNSLVPLNVSSAAGTAMNAGYGAASENYLKLAGAQRSGFIDSQNFGAGVGRSVGQALGSASTGFGAGNFDVRGFLNTQPSADVSNEVSRLGSSTANPFSDYNTGRNGWGSYGE